MSIRPNGARGGRLRPVVALSAGVLGTALSMAGTGLAVAPAVSETVG
jgi:hypothetical protein